MGITVTYQRMEWLNEPPEWQETSSWLSVMTGEKTDFWRTTHYGYTTHNGHAYLQSVEGSFIAQVKFQGKYEHTYDQAGLMISIDEEHWLKAGVEFVGDAYILSVVATNDFSDWSTVELSSPPDEVWIRLTRSADAVRAEASVNGIDWQMLRLAYLEPSATCGVGPMCCSPKGEGLRVTFEGFRVDLVC